jgi:hypothetical protein
MNRRLHHPQPSRKQTLGLWLLVCLAGVLLAIVYSLAESGLGDPGRLMGGPAEHAPGECLNPPWQPGFSA